MAIRLTEENLLLTPDETLVDLHPPAFRKGRRGATSMEYVVVASFILVVLMAGVNALGFQVGSLFTSNAAAVTKATASVPQPSP
jgi:Flp pilus assembly pilin Flp